MTRTWVVAVVVATVLTGCARSNPTYRVNDPSFHSAGPGAKDEIQSVLDSQAGSIVKGDWPTLFALFIPTERARCSLASFTDSAEQSFSGLRERAKGSNLTATMSDLHVEGFRASVNYQFVLPTFGLSSTSQTAHYLKLGDKWFIDEKAC